MRQSVLEVGIGRDAVLGLPTAVADLGKPLVDADDSGYPGRGTKHPDVPRTPVPHSDDADPDSSRSRPHIPTPGRRDFAASVPSASLTVGSLTHCRMERHPRMSGRDYARLGMTIPVTAHISCSGHHAA